MVTRQLPLVPFVSFCGLDTRDAADLHVKALTDDRAEGKRIIAAGAAFWLREIAAALKARLGVRAARVSTREAPDWLIRAGGLVNGEARFLAADLGKPRSYAPGKAESIFGRTLRPLDEAVVAAAESLFQYGLVPA